MSGLQLTFWSDASFASCITTQRSTTGVNFASTGPRTNLALSAVSKRQTCISTSSTEAEVVAAFAALESFVLPALDLWELLIGRKIVADFREDNQATIQVAHTGRNPTMKPLDLLGYIRRSLPTAYH